MLKQYKLKDYNFRLVLWLIAISGVGILLVGSAQHSLQSRQVMGVVMGLAVMLILSLMDFSWILNFYWIIYFGNIIMLLAVRLFGSSAGGADVYKRQRQRRQKCQQRNDCHSYPGGLPGFSSSGRCCISEKLRVCSLLSGAGENSGAAVWGFQKFQDQQLFGGYRAADKRSVDIWKS